MTSPTPAEPEKKFTQADIDRVVADRLTRERTKFADYDDLKAQAAAAAGSKSQLDKIQEQLNKSEERANRAEREALRSSVAQELGLTARQARKLDGATRDEMLADGREMAEDFGIKAPGSKDDGTNDGAAGGEDGKSSTGNGDGGSTGQSDGGSQERQAPRGRPKESLRSGAPIGEPKTEETDPLKLAAGVPRRF